MSACIRIFVLLWLFFSLFVGSPVYATEAPDSISILSAQVVRNTITDGDMTFVAHYNLAYEDYPSEPASSTFIFRLYSPDGLTLLAATTPYVIFNNGYSHGVVSFYFDAEDAPEWGLAYKIDIAGSPLYFDPPPDPYNYVLSDYSGTTDQQANQELLKSYILGVCDLMEQAEPSWVLHGSTDVGIVLTALGEVYFRGAIPGLQSMAPTLFFVQFYTPEPTELTYTDELAQEYGGRLEGTDIMLGFERLGAEFNLSGGTTAAFLVILACIALIIFLAAKGWGIEPGMLGAGIILTLGALLLGNALMVLRFFMAFIGGIMIFYLLFLRRA